MTTLVERIRARPHDAPMPTEYLLDDAADHIETLEAALRTIQDAVPKYLKKEMTAEEFIDAVLAAADDRVVVRAVRGGFPSC